jgi:radical SAM superfamily enzyme YgiQ (UPF0313 family)
MASTTQIHLDYCNQPDPGLTRQQKAHLDLRLTALRERIRAWERIPALGDEENAWLARSFPVLAVLAPVMSTSEEKIEFPGDPMCLYSALSYAVDQAVRSREMGLSPDSPYNDLAPQWGFRPSDEYRAAVDDNGIRLYESPLLNTDQTVFDPRVWNETVKAYFVEKVLAKVKPKVALVSTVSPGHRYALDIARTIRAHLPDCLIVFGGRHMDETIHYDAAGLRLEPSSTPSMIASGQVEPAADFFVSGQGYYALDLLMKAIALAMDVRGQTVSVEGVVEALAGYRSRFGPAAGSAVILARTSQSLHVFPIQGEPLDLAALPSPYKAFAIRARFPIFHTDGHVSRTAHFMVTNACPFHCLYCSEGSTVVGSFLTFGDPGIKNAIDRMLEYVQYGAEAVFFDDSIFWGGNVGVIVNFCRAWSEIRQQAAEAKTPEIEVMGRTVECRKVLGLAWGAQLTVDFLASRKRPEEALLVLDEMYRAGCTYLYIGIESMSEAIIRQVHKNINPKRPWDERVRTALGLARYSGIRVGSSILFGLDGETPETIEETISKVEELVDEDLLFIASPNILTYHPNTEITHTHEMETKLNYHSANLENRPPYVYFEEAFPAVVSRNLSEQDIWTIHRQTGERWGKKRNLNPMAPLELK